MKDPKINFNNEELEATSSKPARVFHNEVAFSSPFWILHLDKYIDNQGNLWREEEVNYFMRLEKEWKDDLPEMGFYERNQIFPEAKEIEKKNLKEQIEKLRSQSQERYNWFIEKVINTANHKDQPALIEYNNANLDEANEKIFKLAYQLKWLKNDKNGDLDIERAKQVPIETFLKVERSNKVKCLFHKEKTASMHINRKKNTFKCFGCDAWGSVIDIVMKLKGCGFVEAVKMLNSL